MTYETVDRSCKWPPVFNFYFTARALNDELALVRIVSIRGQRYTYYDFEEKQYKTAKPNWLWIPVEKPEQTLHEIVTSPSWVWLPGPKKGSWRASWLAKPRPHRLYKKVVMANPF